MSANLQFNPAVCAYPSEIAELSASVEMTILLMLVLVATVRG